MSNGTRRPTFRQFLRPQNVTNITPFLAPPPPLPSVSTTSLPVENVERRSANASQEENGNKKKKQKTNEVLEDQVVPNAKRRVAQCPSIEHNGFDDYYRSRLDAPVFRYNNTNNHQKNRQTQSEDRQGSRANSNGSIPNDPTVIVIE